MGAEVQPPPRKTDEGFPAGFLPGVALSTFQTSGDPNSNWGHWECRRLANNQPTILHGQKCGAAGDFWNRYEEDISLAARLGSRCFRFSVEWSRVEPARGQVDGAALQQYRDMLLCMDRHGLQPVATLHHFVHPQWFEELGGFEKVENIPLYVQYVKVAYAALAPHCRMWLTFNEPSVYVFFGYLHSTFPPGRRWSFKLAGTVLHNLMQAHCMAYYAIKTTREGLDARVGIVHNVMRFQARQDGVSNWLPHVALAAGVLDHAWNSSVLEWFETGRFNWSPLGRWLGSVQGVWPGGKPPLDWVGLNYYSRVVGDWKFAVGCNPGETMTDMEYALWPDGFYKAIQLVSSLQVPIYVTETGVADRRDVLRPRFMNEYFGQVVQAMRDGYDVRGLMYWCLYDNFEWAHGFNQRFGLYEWNDDGSQKRTLRPGAAGFADWCARLATEYELAARDRKPKP